MAFSLYEGVILLQHPGAGPTNHYRMDDGKFTTTLQDYGIAALPMTTNGAVTLRYESGLPSDPLGAATGQNKDTVMATRADSGTGFAFDRPAVTNKLTLMAWVRTDDLRRGGSADDYPVVWKGGNVYGMGIDGSQVFAEIAGVSGGVRITSDESNLIVPRQWRFLATVFDGAAQTWKLFVNGVPVGVRGLAPGQVINHSAGGDLQIGGYNAFGNTGIHGRMQHVTIFNAHALADQVIRDLYRVGVAPPGAEGAGTMLVFPWSREIVPPGPGYDTIDFVNDSPYPVHLSRGSTAVKGGGEMLTPRGGRLPKPSTHDGGWSAILDAPNGYAPLKIVRRRD